MSLIQTGFNEAYYLAQNPSVKAAVAAGTYKSGFEHYERWGKAAGLNPNAYFDEKYYLEHNADVKAAVAAGIYKSGWDHFVRWGQTESSRSPSATFNTQHYLDNNPTVKAAINAGTYSSAFDHFLKWGYAENRAPSATAAPGTRADGTTNPPAVSDYSDAVVSGIPGISAVFTNSSVTGAVDLLTGTANNDTFISVTDGYLETSDMVDGKGGIDTINARVATASTITPTLTSVEIINLRTDGNTAVTLDGSDSTGIQQVWLDRGKENQTTTFTGIKTDTTVGAYQGDGLRDLTVTFTGVAGANDIAKLALKEANVDVVTIAGIETLNVTTSGTAASKVGTLTTAAATTVTVSGSQSLAVTTALGATVNKVDASTLKGGLTAILGNVNGGDATVFGGKGNDVITVTAATGKLNVNTGEGNDLVVTGAATNINADSTVNGGTGTDTIRIVNGAHLISSNHISNFEVLDITGGTGTYDLDHLATNNAITTVSVHDALGGAVTLNNVADTAKLVIDKSTGAITFNQKGAGDAGSTNDVLNVTVSDKTAASTGAITVNSIVAANIEKVNISTEGSSAANTITTLNAANAKAITVSGDKGLTITTLSANTVLETIDATGLTGTAALTIGANSSVAATTILGSTNADTLKLNTGGAGTIQGNGGSDTIDLGAALTAQKIAFAAITDGGGTYAAHGATALTNAGDSIVNFEAAEDKIIITGALKTAVQSTTGSNVGAGAAFNLNSGNGIFQYAVANAGDIDALGDAQTLAAITDAVGIVTNEAIGDTAIIALYDTANDAFAIYAFKSKAADNAINADEVCLLGFGAAGDGTFNAGDIAFS